MMTFDVDMDKKIITCTIEGDEVKYSAVRKIKNLLKNVPANTISFNEEEYLLSDKYVGISKYNQEEETEPFNEENGKYRARKRAFAKYTHAMRVKIAKFRRNINEINDEVLYSLFQYEAAVEEFNEKLKNL